MINYIVARKKNMTDGSIKYYAKVAPVSPVYVNDIAARISKTCTVTEHDVKAVLSALQEQVIYSLSDGHSVRLGDLGSFRPTIACKGMDKAEDLTVRNIKKVRVKFTPSATLEKELSPAFVSFSKYKHVNDVDCEGAPDLEA